MNASNPFIRISLILLVVVTAGLLLAGCGKKEGEADKSQAQGDQQLLASINNLQVAYGAEFKRAAWYDVFAKQAQKENFGDITVLFRALAKSERVHVENIAELLRSKGVEPIVPSVDAIAPGKTRQYLKLSLSNESVEQSTFAGFLAVAEQEQFAEAAELFRRSVEADARHTRLLNKAIEMESNFARMPYMMCPECGYIVGSDKIEECPVCKTKKDKFETI